MQWSKETVLAPSGVSTSQVVRRGERPCRGPPDLALLGQAVEAVGEASDDPAVDARSPSRSISGSPNEIPRARALLRLGDHARGVEQGLRRDAADVEAHAAEPLVALDEDTVERPRSAARNAAV